MDATHTQLDPNHNCGFDHKDANGAFDDKVDPNHTDLPTQPGFAACTTDTDSWTNVSPYHQWTNATEADYGPLFMANGGGPDPDNYDDAELVPLQDALSFEELLSSNWNPGDLDVCAVNTPLHGTRYAPLQCNDDPVESHSVLGDTAAFISTHLPS